MRSKDTDDPSGRDMFNEMHCTDCARRELPR